MAGQPRGPQAGDSPGGLRLAWSWGIVAGIVCVHMETEEEEGEEGEEGGGGQTYLKSNDPTT